MDQDKAVMILDQANIKAVDELLESCSQTQCKKCNVRKKKRCPLGNHLVKVNKEQYCPVPILQAKSLVYDIEVMDENVILKRLQVNLNNMMVNYEHNRDLKMIHDALLSIKHEYFPAINKNLNINMNADELKKQILSWYEENEDDTNPDQGKRREEQNDIS